MRKRPVATRIAGRRAALILLLQATLMLSVVVLSNRIAPSQDTESEGAAVVQGSLSEVRRLKHVHLMIIGGTTLDARDPLLGVAEALRNKNSPRRQGRVYNVLARKLNNYMRKHGSMSASPREDADYLIVFNFLRYRRLLNTYYPSGELYVVVEQKDGGFRFLWKTDKEMLAEDAINRLISEMKNIRGER